METQVHTEKPDTACVHFPLPSGASNETMVSNGVTVSGDLSGSGMFWVEGSIEGSLEIMGIVIVTATGMVKGPIRADTVYVAGCVEGDIFARDLLRLEMTGDINGNVMTASFLIQDGGQLNGSCAMTKAGQEPIFLY